MTDYFHLHLDRDRLLALSSLGLAHLGDSVFEVMVRSWLVLHGKAKATGPPSGMWPPRPRPPPWSGSSPC